jgi:hypothetical protein
VNRIILAVCMFIGAAALSVALAPSLFSDFKLRNQELVTNSSGSFDEATCRTRLVVSFCTVRARGGGFPTFYMITGLGSDESISMMQPKGGASASTFTTNIGLKYFTNRLVTYLGALALSLGLALAAMLRWIPGL